MKVASCFGAWFTDRIRLRRGQRRPQISKRLEVESLEGRLVPATLIVNSANDTLSALDGLTLREALELVSNGGNIPNALGRANLAANEASQISGSFGNNDTIQFSTALSGQSILLTQDLPLVTQDVAIVGLGARLLTISGNDQFAIFDFDDAHASISGLTLRDGFAYLGGAIYSNQSLVVTECSILSNRAGGDDGASGGAIYSIGTASIVACTIAGNSSLESGGGVYNRGSMIIVNSTLSGNSAPIGGAIYNAGEVNSSGAAGGVLQVINCTVVANSATTGGGIFTQNESFDDGTSPPPPPTTSPTPPPQPRPGALIGPSAIVFVRGTTTLNNTIVAGNSTDLIGPVIVGNSRNNLIGSAATASGLADGVNGNIVGNKGTGTLAIASILNTTLSDNGGPTDTLALVLNSPAIDKGDTTRAIDANGLALQNDQRGAGFTRVFNSTVDIGAFESQNQLPVLTAPVDQNAIEGTPADILLGSFADLPANGGPWTVEVNWGDGQVEPAFTTNVQGSLGTRSHAYRDNTPAPGYLVTVKVTDAGGLSDTKTFRVLVSNAAPAVVAAADQTAVEAVEKSFDLGSFSDLGLGDGPWNVLVNWGDGSANVAFQTSTQGSLGSRTHTFADNSHPLALGFTVTVTVTDKDGGSASSDYKVLVSNQLPTGTITLGKVPPFQNDSGPRVISAGTMQGFRFTATDPSAPDRQAGFRYEIDWGDGTSEIIAMSANNGTGYTRKHKFTGLQDYSITLSVYDQDNGKNQSNIVVTTKKPLNLFNGSFLDNTPGPNGEASNILNALSSLGYGDYYDNVGDDDTGVRTSFLGKKLLLVPELERGDRGDFLSSFPANPGQNLRDFVSAGGSIIVFGQGHLSPVNTAAFLNTTFGLSVLERFVGQYDDGVHRFSLSAGAAGTPFADGPASIRINDSTSQLTNLPEDARRIYALDGSTTSATVAILPYSEDPTSEVKGQIIYLGWDWYNSDAPYQDHAWFDVLANALKIVDDSGDDVGPQFAALIESNLLSNLRESYGFYSTGNYNVSRQRESAKWFRDREGKLYALTTDGNLVGWTGKWGTTRNNVIAHVGVDVYNDPTLLFNAPVSLSAGDLDQLAQLQDAYHFHGSARMQRKASQKWFQDDQNKWYVLSADGSLRKWNGKNLAGSPTIATLNRLVFDDPNLLFGA